MFIETESKRDGEVKAKAERVHNKVNAVKTEGKITSSCHSASNSSSLTATTGNGAVK